MRADCPDPEILDIRGMAHEKKYGQLTPAELYAGLSTSFVTSSTSFVTHMQDGRARFLSHEVYQTLPHFNWETIFQFAGMMKPLLME